MDFFEFDVGYTPWGFNYHWLNPVSKAALNREKEVKGIFHQAKTEFEASPEFEALPKGQKHVIENAVAPRHHLTSYTWGTFRPWVEDHHPGWKAKRRELKKEEVAALPANQQKTGSRGKSYYVSFVYQDPSTIKKTKPRGKKKATAVAAAAAAAAANDEDDVGEDDEVLQEPPTKKLKSGDDDEKGDDDGEPPVFAAPVNRTGPFNFQGLPEHMQLQVLSYCDVPTLNALVPVSKMLSRLAKCDRLWEPPLKLLLHELFDDSLELYSDNDVPVHMGSVLSEQSDWRQSTALLRWWQEPRSSTRFSYKKKSVLFLREYETVYSYRNSSAKSRLQYASALERFDFLFQDVSLRLYYHRAGNMAFRSIHGTIWETNGSASYCCDCFCKT